MKGLFTTVFLCLVLCQSASADDKKPTPVKISDVIMLRNALIAATGGHDKIVGQNTIAHNQLYDIDNNARWAMNDDIQILTPLITAIDKTIQEIRTKALAANNGAPIPDKVDEQTSAQKILVQKFNEDYVALLNQTRELPALTHIKRADFKEPLPSEIIVPLQQAGIIDP